MPFTAPIYDRTQADVTNKTPKGFLNVSDINRIESNTQYLAEKLGVSIISKTNWTITDFPKASEMSRVLNNIIAIRAAYYTYSDCPTNPSSPLNLYTKINSIERIQKDIEEIKRINDADIMYMDEFYSGETIGVI